MIENIKLMNYVIFIYWKIDFSFSGNKIIFEERGFFILFLEHGLLFRHELTRCNRIE